MPGRRKRTSAGLVTHCDKTLDRSEPGAIHFSAVSVAGINVLAFTFAIMFASRLIRCKNVLQGMVFLPRVRG